MTSVESRSLRAIEAIRGRDPPTPQPGSVQSRLANGRALAPLTREDAVVRATPASLGDVGRQEGDERSLVGVRIGRWIGVRGGARAGADGGRRAGPGDRAAAEHEADRHDRDQHHAERPDRGGDPASVRSARPAPCRRSWMRSRRAPIAARRRRPHSSRSDRWAPWPCRARAPRRRPLAGRARRRWRTAAGRAGWP